MPKREFVPLAQPRSLHVAITGWFASVKLDGERAVWIPPSAGMRKVEVPFANKPSGWAPRDQEHVATGLWSRNGNIIHAPKSFLQSLPTVPCDLELYAGPKTFQQLRSAVSTFEPDEDAWRWVSACILDAVDMQAFLKPGLIKTRNCLICISSTASDWWRSQQCDSVPTAMPFRQRLDWLRQHVTESERCVFVQQTLLPTDIFKAEALVSELLGAALTDGDEGLMIRSPAASYECVRSVFLQKVKPALDAEGIIVGYYWGREPDNRRSMAGTAYGVRLGAMGGAIVRMPNGKEFVLSGTGFNIAESRIVCKENQRCAADEGILNPGTRVTDDLENPDFPRGTCITYKYRALTDAGLPIDARYDRKRN